MTSTWLRLSFVVWMGLMLAAPGCDGYETGKEAYKRGDYNTALKELRPLADQGDYGAQFYLGRMYELGRGVPQDYQEAARWYRLAVKSEDCCAAQINLGTLYEDGKGVPQDFQEAVRWYRLAADKGVSVGQNNLGTLYINGQGVPQDYAEAFKWYHLAAEQGYAVAQHNLGFMYDEGIGVPQDDFQAYMWLTLAAAQGNEDAVKGLEIEEKKMARAQVAEARRLAQEWEPKGD